MTGYLAAMLTPALSRAARALLDWSQEQLAEASHLGLSTVRDFERGRRVPSHNNLAGIERALRDAGVDFTPENGGGAGVRFRERQDAKPDEGLRPDQLTRENDGGAQG